MKRSFALLLVAGCFPYRELYRPDVRGRVVDLAGAPVAGAEVHTCSYPRWSRPKADCPRFAASTTDADGGFAFAALKEWEWCCLGEAPAPMTEVFVCRAEGGAGFVADSHGWPKEQVLLRLGEGSERCAQ